MTFGEKLRALMAERGMSLRKLAPAVPCDVGHLSRISRNLRTPSLPLAKRLDELLDAGGELTAMLRVPAVLDGGGEAVRVVTDTSVISHHGPVAPELVEYFRKQLPGHYGADMWLGPHMLIPTVDAQTRLIQQLLQAADAPVRRGLLEMGVAYAALLGWLHQDAADLRQSAHWRAVALDMAHRHGDVQLIGYALVNKAMHAIDLGDGAAIVEYAQAVLAAEQRLSPKVRVLALVQRVADEYPWGNACRRTPRYIDVQRATVYGRAGAYEDAARLWDEILQDQPANYRRDTGVFRARQAAALAAARVPEPERVIEIAAGAAYAWAETGSRRLQGELVALPTHASAWAASTHGRELAEIIASVT